jgi:uncharacterized protein involved in response to NO
VSYVAEGARGLETGFLQTSALAQMFYYYILMVGFSGGRFNSFFSQRFINRPMKLHCVCIQL